MKLFRVLRLQNKRIFKYAILIDDFSLSFLDGLTMQLKKMEVFKVSINEADYLISEYGISHFPTLLIFKKGRLCYKEEGVAFKYYHRKIINKHFNRYFMKKML